MFKKTEEVVPDWAGIAAARESEIADLRNQALLDKSFISELAINAEKVEKALSRVGDALDAIEPECHRRDVRGVEVVTLVRAALEGGSDE